MLRTPRLVPILALAAIALAAGPAAADLPDPADSWTEYDDAFTAADAGWFIMCGLSQLLVVSDDCACGDWSVGCQSTRAYWSQRFGLATSAPLTGITAIRFQHRASWTEYDQVSWHLFVIMEPTAAEAAAGIDAKQVHLLFDKAEDWTEVNLAFSGGEWQWHNSDNNMWESNHPDGNTDPTVLTTLEWYLNIPFGFAIGEQMLIDDLALVGTGVAVPLLGPTAPSITGTFPNPANPAVTVALRLPRDGTARLELVDLAGRRVRTLHAGWLPAGEHRLRWDGRDDAGRNAASGTYLVRLSANGMTDRHAVTLVR